MPHASVTYVEPTMIDHRHEHMSESISSGGHRNMVQLLQYNERCSIYRTFKIGFGTFPALNMSEMPVYP